MNKMWEWSIGAMILRGQTETLGEKSIPESFCSPQNPYGLA
jgi:hypothetical protein